MCRQGARQNRNRGQSEANDGHSDYAGKLRYEMSVLDQRALTLHPEWAWAVCFLDKRIENRVWRLPPGMADSRIAIHAGKEIGGSGCDQATAVMRLVEMASYAGWSYYFTQNSHSHQVVVFEKGGVEVIFDSEKIAKGGIVAVATFTGSYKPIIRQGAPAWGVLGQHHWYIKDVDVLVVPVACRGAQRLWRIPPDEFSAIRRQLGTDVFNAWYRGRRYG